MAKPTLKQKLVFKRILELMSKSEPLVLRTIMEESGYSPATAHNPEHNLTGKDGWKQLLAKIEDQPLLDRLRSISLKGDVRASVAAIKELFNLKDRYPASKVKTDILLEQRDKVVEDKDGKDKEEEEEESEESL